MGRLQKLQARLGGAAVGVLMVGLLAGVHIKPSPAQPESTPQVPLGGLPAHTELVFQVRGLDGFRQRLHQFLRECMPAAADIIKKTLDEQVQAFLENRQRDQLDGGRPAFLAIHRLADLQAQPPAVIIGLPVRDANRFVQSFLLPEERARLRPHAPNCQRTVIAEQEVFLVQRPDYVLLTPREDLAKHVLALFEPKPPASLWHQLTPRERQRWSEADVAVYWKAGPLVEQALGYFKEIEQWLERTKREPFGPTAWALAAGFADGMAQARDLEHGVLTGHIEAAGVRVQASLRVRPGSALAKLLAQSRADAASLLDRLPPARIHYGTLSVDWLLTPMLRRYQQVIRQAQLPDQSAQIEQILAEMVSQLLDSRLQRISWGLDFRFGGMVVVDAEKPMVARQALAQGLDKLFQELAKAGPQGSLRWRFQAHAGKLLDLEASRADLEIQWRPILGAHGSAGDADEAAFQHLFGQQWTWWLVADEHSVFLLSTRDPREAERWLKNYRDGVIVPDNATLQRHRQPLGPSLSGLVMLEFNGLWRHLLESAEKALATQGIDNLLPKDAYPEAKPAFFGLAIRPQPDTLELELWAPKETLSGLDRLFALVVHGLF